MIKEVLIKKISEFPIKLVVIVNNSEKKDYYIVPNKNKNKVKIAGTPY